MSHINHRRLAPKRDMDNSGGGFTTRERKYYKKSLNREQRRNENELFAAEDWDGFDYSIQRDLDVN